MFVVFFGLSLCTCAAGHAYISWPIGRQLAAATIEGAHGAPEFDRQSWSGRGAGNFIANCGSRTVDGKYEDVPEEWAPRSTLVTGQVVDFVITITAQHNGAHGFRMICADDRLQERLPPFTDAAWTNLKRNREDPNHMTEFHRTHFTENDWDTMAFIPQAVGNNPATVQFVIPADFHSCNHAVIQWWWKTANSCTPRLFQGQRGQFTEDANLGECTVVAPSDDCIDGDCQMEQFNNCADVVIIGQDSSVSATSTSVGGRPTSMSTSTTVAQSDTTTTARVSNTFTTFSLDGDTTTGATSMTTTGITTSARGLSTTADDGASATSATSLASPSTTSFTSLHCRTLTNQATDQWCTDNCNHIPAFCPPTFCVCDDRSFSASIFLTASSIRNDANASATSDSAAALSKACCSLSSLMQTVVSVLAVWFSTN